MDQFLQLDIQHIIALANEYVPSMCNVSTLGPLPVDAVSIFVNYLISLRPKYCKGAFQQLAAKAAAHITISDDVLDFDDNVLLATGSIFDTIRTKQARHKPFRFNQERCDRLFKDDPYYLILLQLATIGAVIDTDPLFTPQCVPEDFRHTEVTLTKVFQKHALDAWSKGRGLLLRESTLQSTSQINHLHFNSNHLVFKSSDEFARWCVDPSHRSDDNMPLNGGIAKELSITRYQKTWTATLIDMLGAFHRRKVRLNLPWSQFWIIKEDIKACFPQMDMSPESSVLLAMRITATIIFIHLAGSFGWTGAPMAWSIIGSAMLRICIGVFAAIMDLFLICDDFVGFGLKDDSTAAASFIRDLIVDVCGPDSVSLEKSVQSQQAEVIGWFLNLKDPVLGASIRPKDDAISKMGYYFFSFNINEPQSLLLWQILHSFAERYSQALRGFRCFVAAFAHMIRATGPHPAKTKSSNLFVRRHQYAHKKIATASAKFAIVMWRIASYMMFNNPSCMAISIENFLSLNGALDIGTEFDSVSDASPYRVCAALYHHNTKELIGWTSIRLPFEDDVDNRFQCSREYLGLIITMLLIGKLFPGRLGPTSWLPLAFYWINDNTGALTWADKNKATSLASITANMIVSSLQMLSNICLVGSSHLPGVDMGDIDHESRKEDHLLAGDYSTPTLLPELYVNLESNPLVMSILSDCSPFKAIQSSEKDFHTIFLQTQKRLGLLFPSISIQQSTV